MFTPILPLTDVLKKQIILHLEQFSAFSGWKTNSRNALVAWMETTDSALAETIANKIRTAEFAKITVAKRSDNPAMSVVKCDDLDIQRLFRQSSSLVKATKITEAQQEELRSLLSSIVTKIAPFSEGPGEERARRAHKTNAPLLKVSHQVKKEISQLIHPHTMVIRTNDYHSTLSTLKINAFFPQTKEEDGLSKSSKWSLVLLFQDGSRDHYFTQDKELIELIQAVKDLALQLNILEFTMAKGAVMDYEKDRGICKPKYWEGPWDLPQEAGLYYDRINDPLIIEAFTGEVLAFIPELKEGEVLKIAEVGAGKGRLAEKLIKLMENLGIPYHYTFIEPSALQMRIAQRVLTEYCHKIRFINTSIDKLKIEDKVHCVISSGGPLNNEVVTRAEAIPNAGKIQAMLLPKGTLIATGHTVLLVKAKHFSDLRCLSYSAPCVVPADIQMSPYIRDTVQKTFFNNLQRYVLRKPEAAIQQIAGAQADDKEREKTNTLTM